VRRQTPISPSLWPDTNHTFGEQYHPRSISFLEASQLSSVNPHTFLEPTTSLQIDITSVNVQNTTLTNVVTPAFP
jgi:hypothetical protein